MSEPAERSERGTPSEAGVQRVPLCEPVLGGQAQRYLEECLASGYVSSVGPFVERFEQAFARAVGSRFAVACASGTAALHLACRLLDLQPGDEVFVSDLTFIASANPIRYERATPVLVDSERETWNLDPTLVEEELERRARRGLRQPRAVIAVHVLGQPVKMEALAAACERHGVTLIEDAAEALGASYLAGPLAGRQVGTVGRLGCYSFNGNKIITCGGGGMVTTDDPQLARRARHLGTQARLPELEYRHDEVGYNYRLTNLAAALGLSQLEQLPHFLERKRAIARRYDQALGGRPGFGLPPATPWGASSRWLYTVAIDAAVLAGGRDALGAELRRTGIETRPLWTPLSLQAPYREAPLLRRGSGPGVAEELFRAGLSLPCSVSLAAPEQERVIAALTSAGARRPEAA